MDDDYCDPLPGPTPEQGYEEDVEYHREYRKQYHVALLVQLATENYKMMTPSLSERVRVHHHMFSFEMHLLF
jgi:hypothetical protein